MIKHLTIQLVEICETTNEDDIFPKHYKGFVWAILVQYGLPNFNKLVQKLLQESYYMELGDSKWSIEQMKFKQMVNKNHCSKNCSYDKTTTRIKK